MSAKAERLMTVYYRWEFLRRNSEFRNHFDRFVAKFGGWFEEHGWWYDPEVRYSTTEQTYLNQRFHRYMLAFIVKWHVENPVPYQWQFEKSGRYELRPGVFVEMPSTGMIFARGDIGRLSESELRDKAERRTGWADHEADIAEDLPDSYWDRDVYLRVDITFPVEHLVEKFEAEIRAARREYKQKHGPIPRKEFRPRRLFEQFDSYLSVWDLKQKGLTLPQIAKQLYPGMHALDRVTDHFRRAKELISGGYRELE